MLLIENYLIIWLYAETKDSRVDSRVEPQWGRKAGTLQPYGFVPPRSVGALITLHYVGAVQLEH